MTPLAKLEFVHGALVSSSPNLPLRSWMRPAELAQARLACEPSVSELDLPDGSALLAAAFTVLPFAAPPYPAPRFGAAVTPAARAAFGLFAAPRDASDDFFVMRGEPDDFLVCAERTGAVWRVAGFTVAATTLTVRVEDVWTRTPSALRRTSYRAEVRRDPHGKDASEAIAGGMVVDHLADLAPDARICLDVAANGGFLLTFSPL